MKNAWILFTILLLLVAQAFGDQDAQAGRQIVAKWQDAVVTVQLVLKTSMSFEGEQAQNQEEKSETIGTVIDPSGLVVVSLSALNPAEAWQRMMPNENVKVSSDVTDVKLILPDGKEMPASVVLRDKDLDLAFIRTKDKPAKPLSTVDFKTAAKPELMDQAIILYRLGTVGSRALAACTDRVQSVIEKPRILYALGLQAMGASLGAPVFAMDSNPIGLLLLRTSPGGMASGAGMFGGIGGTGLMYVVLPASDVVDAARQAENISK